MTPIKLKDMSLSTECSEAYKSLRTNIQFCGEDKKVIVLTSCTPDEGKSTVALQLAISLAEANRKVLIVDGDLRKSVLMGKFELEEEVKGFTHFLSGQAELHEVIQRTDKQNLDIIFAGPIPPNPAELLADRPFKQMVKECRDIYDYVIIDSPPLGSVIDGAVIAGECDGAVIVIEAEVISYRFVQEIKEQLEKSGCPILGTILNKVDMRQQKYYGRYYGRKYGRYYGKYYGYGHYDKK